jgi:hypothetical protein
MSSTAKSSEIDALLHPVEVAKLLGVSPSWLAKSRWPERGRALSKLAGPFGMRAPLCANSS